MLGLVGCSCSGLAMGSLTFSLPAVWVVLVLISSFLYETTTIILNIKCYGLHCLNDVVNLMRMMVWWIALAWILVCD